jgi:MFS family permease
MAVGLLLAAAGFAIAAALPGLVGLLAAALTIGAGTGLVTPLGFAALAAATPPERLGQTMGSAEVGRELGDAGGPLLAGAIATATTVAGGLLGLAAVLASTAAIVGVGRRARPTPTTPS